MSMVPINPPQMPSQPAPAAQPQQGQSLSSGQSFLSQRTTRTSTSAVSASSNNQAPQTHSTSSASIGPFSLSDKQVYWCIDKNLRERPQTMHSRIELHWHTKETTLFAALSQDYEKIRGWRAKFLSWKSCHDIEFIKVRPHVRSTSQTHALMRNIVLHRRTRGARRSQTT